MVHRWKATGLVIPHPDYLKHARTFSKRLREVAPNRHELWPEGGQHEVGVSVSCLPTATIGVYYGTDEGTDAWKAAQPDDCITGTMDYLGTWWDGNPWVDDLKTGREAPSPRSAQWWLYALAAHRIHLGAPDHVVVTCTHWPRYPATGAPDRGDVLHTITRRELESFERHIRLKYEQWEEIRFREALDPNILNPGERQCRYCPSAHVCPTPYTE